MALRSLCSSPSSSRVRVRTQVASNEKTPSPDIGREAAGLTNGRPAECGVSVNASGVDCWSGSTSEYPGGGELTVERPLLVPLATEALDVT